ncbi:MAG: insulinase family protein [Novosphingobium sp.]|nr:insulinase family protein [Novosphingobium sp.]
MPLKAAALSLLLAFLAACAPQAEQVASVSHAPVGPDVVWAFEASDIPVDPGYRFGRLGNGMRYVIRQNATPAGTAIVRMNVKTGSLDETDSELGFAHFVEHMAFNGSTNVPEGEMVRLLERNGLAFGADTNASTGFDRTTYKLDLPRNDLELLDIALMLMRETASELSFSPDAVDRERGVVLSELRDRNSFQLRNAIRDTKFLHPDALYPRRFPIGDPELLKSATAEALKAFWAREYVPEHTVVVVIGDIDPDLVEKAIAAAFDGWQARPVDPQPGGGPVRLDDSGRTQVYIDPALSERTMATRHGSWLNEPDTIAHRQENLLRQIGYNIVNRRLQRLSRQADPPFRSAGFGTGNVFKDGRSTRLIVDTADGKWQRGLEETVTEYRRALKYGFTDAEVTEQVANIRTASENGAASADTRSNFTLARAVFALINDETVPSHPASSLARFEAFAPQIEPGRVIEAMKRDALDLADPLLRLRGRLAPKGGKRALRTAWNNAMRQPLSREAGQQLSAFAYSDFGESGEVIGDETRGPLAIRTILFANGTMLNLRRTELEKERIRVQLSIDGGKMLDTRVNPLATDLIPYFDEGGLGAHSEDELQSILAGRTVQANFFAGEDTFISRAVTTPRDLEAQLQLLAAFIIDPGYRPEGETKYRHQINNFFKQLRATPGTTLSSAIGGLLSDNDPRFTLLDVEDYRELTFSSLNEAIADRLTKGALEIGLVGDFDEDQAIALVARTFGALPLREDEFRPYDDQPTRTFTADRSRRIILHQGPKDQAMLHIVWPTRDDSDPVETIALGLLERITRVELTETLREALGKAYSPGASSHLSRSWAGYGTFSIRASVDVGEIAATRDAIREKLISLRKTPVSNDVLQRARQPMIESYEQALKSNAGWLALVDRAQTDQERIERYLKAKERLLSLTSEDIRSLAGRYLDPDQALEILVLPEGITAP